MWLKFSNNSLDRDNPLIIKFSSGNIKKNMTEEEMFNKLLEKDPNPGSKNRLNENDNNLLIPGWVIGDTTNSTIEVNKHSTKKFYKDNNINSQILYDILILGLTNINQRPRCPICNKLINYRGNLLGKYSGYNNTCSLTCNKILNKDKFHSKESVIKATETRKANGSYNYLHEYMPHRYLPHSDESKLKQSLIMKGRKLTDEHIKKSAEGRSLYYKNNPDKLLKFINSPKGHSKRGEIKIKKSTNNYKYLSNWEKLIVEFLDTVDDVISIENPKAIEYMYDNTKHYYYADIDISLKNNIKLLIEIKPTVHLYHKKNKAKFEAGRNFVKENKSYSKYLILTEKDIFEDPRKQDKINEEKILNIIKKFI